QIAGRASRNIEGTVIFYADKMSAAMKSVIDETNRRRDVQHEHNQKQGITPKTIYKSEAEIRKITSIADMKADYKPGEIYIKKVKKLSKFEALDLIDRLTIQMQDAAKELAFEKAAALRDEILAIRKNKS
ncbi:MAG: UvrB/UvrC motif-containing protein, partial [Candidatus Marinimicrobia bacterium]|nr:UvrB/UvrC motif-containing protein [Candidatus Neomarinimicrobiota bacterium]